MQQISKFLPVVGQVFKFSDEWLACDIKTETRAVRGFGTTAQNAIDDAWRLYFLNLPVKKSK